MKWNVYYHDINARKIKTYNIFDHGGFRRDVEQDLHRCKVRAEFEKLLKSNLMYYFWSKCEWEILISPWVGDAETIKVDVYDQVMLNWDEFVDYCWTH